MARQTKNNANKSWAAGLLLVPAVLSAALFVSPSSVQAMSVVEVGPSQFHQLYTKINTLLQQAQAKAEYVQQNTRWIRTLQQYQRELIRIQGMVMSFSLRPNEPMREIAEDRFVRERCGGDALGLTSLLQSFSLNPDGDLVAQQRQICTIIQTTQNRKYNATIKYMREIAPMIERDLNTIGGRRAQSNDQGQVAGVTYDAATFANHFEQTRMNYENQMNMYDQQIKSMEDAQRTLAQIALMGSKASDPLGTLVKTAALQGALKAGK